MSLARALMPQRAAGVPRRVALSRVFRRGMAADQKTLRARMAVVTSIQKITKAMKMVSAAKLNGLQRNLGVARDFQAPLTAVWQPHVKGPFATRGLVIVTSDKGLCGGLNSGLTRKAKGMLLAANVKKTTSPPYSIIPLGNKGRGALERHYGRFFLWQMGEYAKLKTMSFRSVAILADKLLKENIDEFTFMFNRFKNLLTSEQQEEKLYGTKLAIAHTAALKSKFTIESGGYSDVLKDLYEFRFAVRLFHMFAENMTTEMSSRMNAMSNSSKAAGEMLQLLTMQYNRSRQAKITTELIEIVSGAAALDAGKD